MVRDFQVRCLPKRVLEEDKRSRTYMTACGMKTFRVQPTVNNSSLAKYQPRSRSAPQPRAHSTPVPPSNNDRCAMIGSAKSSSMTRRSASPRSVVSSPKPPALGSTCSSPVQYYTNHRASDSHHTRAFTSRNLSCTPTHLYMADHVRKAAAQLHRASSSSSQQTATSNRTQAKQINPETPTRFGKPINLPAFVKTNPHLKNKQLSMGQKQYLWGIARIYSMSHMKSQVQQQYQTLLDYEFRKRMQRMGISEQEKVKEMKDYLRYKKFIKNYDQRIPRSLRSKDAGNETSSDADHIHKHVIKGWTTKDSLRDRYSAESSCVGTGDYPEDVESQEEREPKYKRGAHIYKHVIKGWTMDPRANDVFQRNSEFSESTKETKISEAQSEKDEVDVYTYRVDMTGSNGDIVKITRVYDAPDPDKVESQDEEEPIEVIVQSTDSNYL